MDLLIQERQYFHEFILIKTTDNGIYHFDAFDNTINYNLFDYSIWLFQQ